jgi:hypothetical protein
MSNDPDNIVMRTQNLSTSKKESAPAQLGTLHYFHENFQKIIMLRH